MRGNDDQIDRRRARGRRHHLPVTTFVLGRTMMWTLALWTAYIATWATVSGSRPAIVAAWWLAGVALLQAIAHHVDRPWTTSTEASPSSEHGHLVPHVALVGGAVQDWESEGGAIA